MSMVLMIVGALMAFAAIAGVCLSRAAARGDRITDQALREERIRHHTRNVREAQ